MKKVYATLALLFIICLSVQAQVGLLSSNNKNIKPNNLNDSNSYKLVRPNKDSSISLETNGPDTSAINQIRKIAGIEAANSNIQSDNVMMSNKLKTIDSNNIIKKKVPKKKQKQIDQQNNDLKNQYDSLKIAVAVKASESNIQTLLIKKKDSLFKESLKRDYALNYNIYNKKFESLYTAAVSIRDAANKNYFLARDYKDYLDSSKKIKDPGVFSKSIADIETNFISLNEDAIEHKNLVEQKTSKLDQDNILNQASKYTAEQIDSALQLFWGGLAKDTLLLSKKVEKDQSIFEKIYKQYDDLIHDQIIDKNVKTEPKQTDFGAFPQLTTILGKKEVIPELQLYGKYDEQNITQSFEASLGISFAPTSTPDTANLYTIFLPTASKFLVHSNFTWSFLPVGTKDNDTLAKKIGLRLDVSFASKNLLYDTTKTNKTITSSFLYAKAGIEVGIIPKRLSIYSNVNTATIMDQVDEFQFSTGVHSKFLGYIDCGARLYFDPTPAAKVSDGLFIYSNLNFIINSGDVKRVTKSNDTVIPSIQVGLVKSLGKF